jgi:hypothetical protein
MSGKPTRRVRANSAPPEDDLPIQYWHNDNEPEAIPEDDLVSFLIALVIIFGFIVAVMYAI